MRVKFYSLVAGLGLLATAAPMMAHHSFTAEYDASKPVTLTGTVTKVEWMNPHARFYIDVKDDSGTVTNWELGLGSPNALMRLGWTRHSLERAKWSRWKARSPKTARSSPTRARSPWPTAAKCLPVRPPTAENKDAKQ